MPPKKKNNVHRTGIYYLAVEYRQTNPSYARMSMQDLILLALPHWRSMSLVQRKPYEDLAKQYKRDRMLNNEHVITPVIPSSEEISFLEKNSNENKYLDEYLSNDLNDVFQRSIFFVNFQIFCRTDDEDGGDYYPAELAIMKYSFAQGIQQEYYTIIKPEQFPVGYTGTAIDHSRETHQIPPYNFIGANGDYAKIWQEFKRVIGGWLLTIGPFFHSCCCLDSELVFCNAFERDQTVYLLKWLASKDVHQSTVTFRVCSFEAFVCAVLRRLGLGEYAHQSVREQLRRPIYTLQVKDRCIYHDSLAIQYCCRAMNHGFSLFLDGFVRERFAEQIHLPTAITIKRSPSPSIQSMSSVVDSISSLYLDKVKEKVQLGSVGSNVFIQSTNSPMSILSIENKVISCCCFSFFASIPYAFQTRKSTKPIKIDCRWPISSLYTNETTQEEEDSNQLLSTGRGRRPMSTTISNRSDSSLVMFSIGRGRRFVL